MRGLLASSVSRAVLACLLFGVTSGCQSVERFGHTDLDPITPGVTKREDIYLRYGPPTGVYHRADRSGQTLVYSHSRVNGINLGARMMMATVSFADARSATSSTFIDLSRDDIVSRVRQLGEAPPSPGWSLWPFGD